MDPSTPGASPVDEYSAIIDRIDARSARSAGMIADQRAGEAAAKLGLHRTAALLDRLDQPQDAFTIVHVAGSKGKGSTSAMVAAILSAAGHRVGRATSPHLHRYTERMAVDGHDVPDGAFTAAARMVLDAADELERDQADLGMVNAYEALFATALVAFRESGCVVGVVEVGIGGRLDASNVVDPAVSVITTLDLEHTAILGPTLVDIAREKAGLIKPGRSVVVAPQEPSAMTVIREVARATGSPLVVIRDDDVASVPPPMRLSGPHQRLNAAVAVGAVVALASIRPELDVDHAAIDDGLAAASLPGRFEVVDTAVIARFAGTEGCVPVVVLDGAHTPRAAATIRETVAEEYGPDRRIVAVFGAADDKDTGAVLRTLSPAMVVPVAAESPRAVPVAGLATIAEEAGCAVATTGDGSVHSGLALAIASDSDSVVLITGSFGVIAAAREAFGIV